MFYIRHLINSIDAEAIKQKKYRILLDTKSQYLAALFKDITSDMDCGVEINKRQIKGAESVQGYDLAIRFEDDGERLQIFDESEP